MKKSEKINSKTIWDEISKLSLEQKEQMIKDLKDMIAKEYFNTSANDIEEIICQHCGSKSYIKKGIVSDIQRYLCNDCNRNFSMNTHSILSNSQLDLSVWLKYAECFVNRLSLRAAASTAGVSLKTSFFMRHRILECITKYTGEFRLNANEHCEMDECFIRENFKGNHTKSKKKLPRAAHKRGKDHIKPGMSSDQICILTAINSKQDVFAAIACRGSIDAKTTKELIQSNIAVGSIVNTDKKKSYIKVFSELKVEHNQYDSKKDKGKLNFINGLHSRLKSFLSRYHGVATRRLEHYIAWFKWIESYKKIDNQDDRKELLLEQIVHGKYKTSIREYPNTPYLFYEYWEKKLESKAV
jgi:transposase-like protein